MDHVIIVKEDKLNIRKLVPVILLSASCILLPASLFSQISFEKTYGGGLNDEGYSVHESSLGGYIISGTTESFGSGGTDVYLVRTDENGDTLWTKTLGGSDDEQGYFIRETQDTGFIIAGYTLSSGAGKKDIYLVKTSASGVPMWEKTFGGLEDEEGYSVHETSDGGFIIVGKALSFGLGNWDVYVIRTNSTGDTLWTRTYGSTADDIGLSGIETPDGGFIIVGYTSVAGTRDVYIIKTDTLGDTLWTKIYGGSNWEMGYSVLTTVDRDYVVLGHTNSFGAGLYDIYMIKTNSQGDSLWTRTYGGTSSEYGYSIQTTSDAGYIIAGRTNTFGAGDIDAYMIKTNPEGDTLWTRTFGGLNQEIGRSAHQTSDGGYILAGQTQSFGAGGNDIYLIKTNSIGLGIEEEPDSGGLRIAEFGLYQNHPNPFNKLTVISYIIPANSSKQSAISGKIPVKLSIYDITGRLVLTMVDEPQNPGIYQLPITSNQLPASGRTQGLRLRLSSAELLNQAPTLIRKNSSS
jgi:hypothetical protein